MGRNFIRIFLAALFVILSYPLSIQADESAPIPPDYTFTGQELDNLLAPIALYPDPLLAQILPASTYPSEVADEAAWLRGGGNISSIDGQNWAESVRAIAHYPQVVYMMADNIDWTANLGDAFMNQPEDVTNSIQRLRLQASQTGNLVSTPQQEVLSDGNNIYIDPAQPQYIYVPEYNPADVYVQPLPPGMTPLITFGLGLVIGDWLNMDFDWHSHHIFYHGWNRPGWVNQSRPFVHITNVLMNRNRPYINKTWRHDPSHGDPGKFLHGLPGPGRNGLPSEVRGRGMNIPATTSRSMFGIAGTKGDLKVFSNRGKESRTASQQGYTPPAPAVNKRPKIATPAFGGGFAQPRPSGPVRETLQTPGVSSAGRGFAQPPPAGPITETQQPPRVPSGAFGDYRGAAETAAQSSRGQASRQSAEVFRLPSAAVNRGGTQGASVPPAGRSIAPSGGQRPRR